MVWTTAGVLRTCSRCLELKGKVIGTTDESGVTLPPIHPRCRCAIVYREAPFNFDVQRFGDVTVHFRRFTTVQEAQDYFKTASDVWLTKLTAYEKSTVTQYTGKAYEKINSYLRGELPNAKFKPAALTELRNKIAAIENALSKFELQDNIVVYRQCGAEFLSTLNKARFGLLHEEGFCSTSAVEGSVKRGSVQMEIFLGAGAGAWLKPLSLNPTENEFLINRGAYFKIIDLKREGAYTRLKLLYVGSNAGGILKMKARTAEAITDLDEWLTNGEYQTGERFESKQFRPVETQEEFDKVVNHCIKARLFNLPPEKVKSFFALPNLKQE